jgi:predicted RNA-binding Zn-ribbon protein involved in translation (DUF1610 family)
MKNKEELLKEKTYTKDFSCINCGNTFIKSFRFGQVAEKGECPRCGVSDEQLSRPNYKKESWF